MQNKVDKITPECRWEFNQNVVDVFDDMLQRSIPQYDSMRDLCFSLSCKYRQDYTDIVDLGCSRGEAVNKLIDRYGSTNRYIGVDVSEPMLSVCRDRFKPLIDSKIVEIKNLDLRKDYPNTRASVTLCILTLQFTPIEYRNKILKNIYDSTVGGGALIIVEKIISNNSHIDDLMVDTYYEMKRSNGYSQESIDKKRTSLEGVLVPVTAKYNEEILMNAGFKYVECFWRWMNFAGWIAVKDKKRLDC